MELCLYKSSLKGLNFSLMDTEHRFQINEHLDYFLPIEWASLLENQYYFVSTKNNLEKLGKKG